MIAKAFYDRYPVLSLNARNNLAKNIPTATPAVDPAVISLVAREVIDLIQDEYEHGAAGIEPGIVAILNKHFGAGK
jgi:hypothetical protein